MLIDIRLPDIHFPRKWSHPSKDWQRWFVVFPRLVHIEGETRRVLIMPGWHETRISCTLHRRVWRAIGGDA